MTWSDFTSTVLAFLNRASADIPTIGSTTLLVTSANFAKLEAQRRHSFKMARSVAFASPTIDGVSLSTLCTDPNASPVVSVSLKRLEQMWQYTTVANGVTNYYRRTMRIPAMTLGDLKGEYPSTVGFDPRIPPVNIQPTMTQEWYIQGTSLYLIGATTAQPVMCDIVQWLPPYDGTTTDFFLTYHADWLVYATLEHMNQFLKEDQRVPIDEKLMERKWKSVITFDENFAEDNFEAGGNN